MSKRRIQSLCILALAALTAAPAGAASKGELAAEQFRKAAQLLEDLRAVPSAELGERQYDLVYDAFRKVHWITPSSSYCDDALYHAAEAAAMKAERFRSEELREKAIQAFRFLISEYPHSGLLADAKVEIARLESGQGGPAPRRAPAADTEPERVTLTRAEEPEAEPSAPPEAATPVSTADVIQPLANRAQPSPDRTRSTLAGVSDLRYFSQPDGVRIVVELDDYVPYKFDFLTRPNRLYFDLFTSQLAGSVIQGASYEVGDGAVARIRLGQNRRTKARLVVDLLDEVTYDVSWLANPPRLVIQLQGRTQRVKPGPPPVRIADAGVAGEAAGKPVASAPAPVAVQEPQALAVSLAPPKPASANSAGGQSLIRALGLKIGRVVIDAGHGGHDPGMIGPSGLREKDVVLDISQRLARLIEDELGAEAILTRDSDRFVDLQDRTRAANAAKADLFVSVHANASDTRSVRGVETFFLSLEADSWALKVASRENAASNRSVAELQDLLGKIVRNDTLDESRELAGKIQTAVYAGLAKEAGGQRNRGVRKAPLLVLMGARMPAVLAEVGFLSNPTDEKLFKTSKHRQFVAEQIFSGVRDYVESLSTHQLTMRDEEESRAQLDD